MPKAQQGKSQPSTDAAQKRYQTQKRLADALFGLFRTLGSTLSVERVAQVGLLTLTGQLLIKRAAFFARDGHGDYRLLTVVGVHWPELKQLVLPGRILEPRLHDVAHRLLDLEALPGHESLERLAARGFRNLVLLLNDQEPLGLIVLGEKIVPAPLTAEDRQILEAFSVVAAPIKKNSIAYQLVERSRNELQRLDEMKREFMSHVSHEFRTPLTVLKNTAELTPMEPELAEMQRSALARLEYLVGSILLFNDSAAGEVALDREPIDLQAWVAEEVRPLLEARGDFELHVALPAATIRFDRQKIRIALESVVDNAMKFGSKEQKPQVHLYLSSRRNLEAEYQRSGAESERLDMERLHPQAAVDPASADALLVIEVKDRGIGIPPEELESVFQPFTQALNSPTRGVRGPGLGLAMAKRIVEAHGGEILCRSAVERGTILCLVIPTAPVFARSRAHRKGRGAA